MNPFFSQDSSQRSYPDTDALPRCLLRWEQAPDRKREEDIQSTSFSFNKQHFKWLSIEERLKQLRSLEQMSKKERIEEIELLLCSVDDNEEQIRVQALDLLGTLGDTMPLSSVCAALNDPSWKVRAAAAQALGNCQDSFPCDVLTDTFIKEQDMTVREIIVRNFGKHPKYIPLSVFVKSLLQDPFWIVREAVAWALGQLGADVPVDPLLRSLLYDEDESVRAAAALSLGRSGKQEVAPFLYKVLAEDMDREVCDAAALALQELDEETRGLVHGRVDDQRNILPTRSICTSTDQEKLLQAVILFITNKQGCINRNRFLQTEKGSILLLNFIYKRDDLPFLERMRSLIKDKWIIEPLDKAIYERDEIVRNIAIEVCNDHSIKRWQDLFLIAVSLDIPRSNTDLSIPCRVIVTGMGCHQVREYDTSVINKFIDIISEKIPDVLFGTCKPQLTDVKIWHRMEVEQPIT